MNKIIALVLFLLLIPFASAETSEIIETLTVGISMEGGVLKVSVPSETFEADLILGNDSNFTIDDFTYSLNWNYVRYEQCLETDLGNLTDKITDVCWIMADMVNESQKIRIANTEISAKFNNCVIEKGVILSSKSDLESNITGRIGAKQTEIDNLKTQLYNLNLSYTEAKTAKVVTPTKEKDTWNNSGFWIIGIIALLIGVYHYKGRIFQSTTEKEFNQRPYEPKMDQGRLK